MVERKSSKRTQEEWREAINSYLATTGDEVRLADIARAFGVKRQ